MFGSGDLVLSKIAFFWLECNYLIFFAVVRGVVFLV
jgi:hypothetical protein